VEFHAREERKKRNKEKIEKDSTTINSWRERHRAKYN
jgi:hypothetical protein